MCELLGMSANVPTDLCFSFTGLRQRGGGTGPHKDGWGVIFYEGIDIRSFHDPGASVSSEVTNLLARYPIKSTVAMCHIRQANVGSVALENTHPFVREFGGRYWSFARNGQLPGFHLPDCGMAQRYRPVGQTDSEALSCCLLNEMLEEGVDSLDREQLVQRIVGFCAQHAQTGVFNIILSNGLWLFSFCSTKLAWITRRAPFWPATLRDGDIKVDFRSETTPHDVVSVVATSPLTYDEGWRTFARRLVRMGSRRACRGGACRCAAIRASEVQENRASHQCVRGGKNTQTGRGACSGRLTICAPVYPVSGGSALDEAWQRFFRQLSADAAVLDVGTGNGALALLARETLGPFAEVHGVDVAEIDPTTFVSSVEGLQSITFHPGVAMEQLPFDDDVFNAVVGQYALEYSDTARSVVEVLRVLKGDGRFRFLVHASGGTLEARNVLQQRQAQTQRSALNEKRFPVYTARRPRVVLSGLCCG